MKELVGTPREAVYLLPIRKTTTLREPCVRMGRHDGGERLPVSAVELKCLFPAPPHHANKPDAAAFVRRLRRDMRRKGARRPGEYQYTTGLVLEDLIRRAQELHVLVPVAEEQAKLNFKVPRTVHSMNWSGRHQVAV